MAMNLETYRDLCETSRFVVEVADRYSDSQRCLGEWRPWARLFLSGLHDAKAARRAARAALLEADVREGARPLVVVAAAAALVATGAYHAIGGDENAARYRTSAARVLLQGLAAERAEAKREA